MAKANPYDCLDKLLKKGFISKTDYSEFTKWLNVAGSNSGESVSVKGLLHRLRESKKNLTRQQYANARDMVVRERALNTIASSPHGLQRGTQDYLQLIRDGSDHYFGWAQSMLAEGFRKGRPFFLGIQENKLFARNVKLALAGKHVADDTISTQFAQNVAHVFGEFRKAFSKAGVHIGELDDFFYPQTHNASAVWKAGKDEWINLHQTPAE